MFPCHAVGFWPRLSLHLLEMVMTDDPVGIMAEDLPLPAGDGDDVVGKARDNETQLKRSTL